MTILAREQSQILFPLISSSWKLSLWSSCSLGPAWWKCVSGIYRRLGGSAKADKAGIPFFCSFICDDEVFINIFAWENRHNYERTNHSLLRELERRGHAGWSTNALSLLGRKWPQHSNPFQQVKGLERTQSFTIILSNAVSPTRKCVCLGIYL